MVSVVITAYNVEAWIEQCVLSVCKQSLDDIEIIVVEDCSTDGTRDILARIREPRLKVLYNNTNVGAGASRKRGIEAANGEYILLLDGDDWIDKDFIGELHAKAIAYDADIVSGGITIRREDGSREKDKDWLEGNISDEVRRNLVYALERIAMLSKDAFPFVAKSLLILSSAENESFSNNSSGVFVQLFHILLAGLFYNLP